ncbi:LysR family transcriptional regulator [Actinacidiphila sp. bgisy145]|uniref:LysR family transcriptional regulator n=1 Tax=Actinacidiphila sp. bgisy145 TaxID=3413792 RepID=UPI003EBB95BD
MELRQLEYFVAVAEERHFTKAARRLLVSQSGLSAAVRALERELGSPLFVRTTRSVELTGAGRALLGEATRTLAGARAAKEAVAAVQGLLRGSLAVGTEQCVTVDVGALLARFRARHGGVEVRLRQAGSAVLAQDVADGRLDLAFVSLPGPPPDGVRLLPLTAEPMVLLCDPGHPLAGAARVEWAALAGETFVDWHQDWGARQLTDRAFAACGAARRVALEVYDVHTLIDLVRHGLGVAVVPRPISRKEQAATLAAVPVTGPGGAAWEVSVALPRGARPSPAARELLSYLEPAPGTDPGPVPGQATEEGNR